jgi:UDP-N-acetylglucosamine 2-epimerase (non-hydrolysing)
VHTGQNYDFDLNEVFFRDLEIRRPDYFLNAAGQTTLETIGNILIKMEPVLESERPEAFLILGDTNSCLAAIAAKRKRIPVFHMEAGNRCFDQRVPEEMNRRIVDHIADINMPYSEISREYLLREGIHPDKIIKTGSPMYEVLHHNLERILTSKALDSLNLSPSDYFVASIHREENVDSPDMLNKLISALNHVSERYSKRIIFSAHPRTRKRLFDLNIKFDAHVEIVNPFGFLDYVYLQMNAHAVLSDSGTITEESSILNFPALNLREAHERPEGMEEGSVMMTGINADRILQGLNILENQPKGQNRILRGIRDYEVPNVSDKVIRIIHSYVDYVRRTVWRESF